MFNKTRTRITAVALSAAVITSALTSPISITGMKGPPSVLSDAVITANAAENITIDDFPSEYKYAADWIWNNRIVSERSVEAWNTIFDQIVAEHLIIL